MKPTTFARTTGGQLVKLIGYRSGFRQQGFLARTWNKTRCRWNRTPRVVSEYGIERLLANMDAEHVIARCRPRR